MIAKSTAATEGTSTVKMCQGCAWWLLFLIIAGCGLEAPPDPVCSGYSEICRYLTAKYDQGLAAGNAGDYYLNADDGHTNLETGIDHPQVTHLPGSVGTVFTTVPDKVIVGNASLAHTLQPAHVSLTRYNFFTSQSGADLAYQQYTNNNAFWYPAHHDHLDSDRYPGMMATVSNSQGSSGSEMDEVKKFFWALAAFRPETKELLRTNGLLFPTVQMIFRRVRVTSDGGYLSAKAHPNAFDDSDDALAVAHMANAIIPSDVPPMVQLEVVSDSYDTLQQGECFDADCSQKLYDTPVSISRLWRNRRYTQTMTISARKSYDLNDRPLSYHWVVIRGEPDHVRIQPQNPDKSAVVVDIDYHSETAIKGSQRTTNLVVVGAFVHNGAYFSAPAFVTSYTFPIEHRVYDPVSGRLLEISYEARAFWEKMTANKSWSKDVFHYDEGGNSTGWTRTKRGQTYDFTPEGYQVITRGSNSRPKRVQRVTHRRRRLSVGVRIDWTRSGAPFPYESGSQLPMNW